MNFQISMEMQWFMADLHHPIPKKLKKLSKIVLVKIGMKI